MQMMQKKCQEKAQESDINARGVNQPSKKIPRRIYMNSSITSVLIATWKRIHVLLSLQKKTANLLAEREAVQYTRRTLKLSLADILVHYNFTYPCMYTNMGYI